MGDNNKRPHDVIRDTLMSDLDARSGYNASTERWIDTEIGRTRVDVLLKGERWNGLEKKVIKWGFEVKRNTGSANSLHRQCEQYKSVGIIPIPVLPFPSTLRYSDKHDDLLRTAESNCIKHTSSIVYYDDDYNWKIYNPVGAGLQDLNWGTTDEPLYTS